MNEEAAAATGVGTGGDGDTETESETDNAETSNRGKSTRSPQNIASTPGDEPQSEVRQEQQQRPLPTPLPPPPVPLLGPGMIGEKGHERTSISAKLWRREVILPLSAQCPNPSLEMLYAQGKHYEAEGHAKGKNPGNLFHMAKQCYLQAAESGHLGAQCEVGRIYEQGIGCPVDVEEAFRWYETAAQRQFPEADNNLGALLYTGAGGCSGGAVRADPTAAAALFERARQRGNAAACNNLALLYEEGRGDTEQDLERAQVLYEEAAAGGIVAAYASAGNVSLMRGNVRDAMESFQRGVAHGSELAAQGLKILSSRQQQGTATEGAEGGRGGGGGGGGVGLMNDRGDACTYGKSPGRAASALGSVTSHISDDGNEKSDEDLEQPTETTELEKEMTRYYKLSQAFYDTIVISGDQALIRAADDAVKEIFPEVVANGGL